ncbi:MAG: HEPN domain-containing protein [Desulfobulbaceae bacterium]|nr:HEPN domain-containing protein [Desulfobulbaceae bacterium]
MVSRYRDWLRQAENDLQWAEHSRAGGFWAQTCFVAQQAAEKALKALCFLRGYDVVRTHSLFQIVRTLAENGDLEKHARELDLYYISGRYPDAFPGGAPFEMFGEEQASRALASARTMMDIVREKIGANEE